MKKMFAITLCAFPLAFGSAVYAQGPAGPTGTGDQSPSTEAGSTPSALGGNSNANQNTDQVQPAPRSTPKPTTANRPTDANTGVNRSSTGDDKGTPQSNMPGNTSGDASANMPHHDGVDSQDSSRSAGAAKPSVSPAPSTDSSSGTTTKAQ